MGLNPLLYAAAVEAEAGSCPAVRLEACLGRVADLKARIAAMRERVDAEVDAE